MPQFRTTRPTALPALHLAVLASAAGGQVVRDPENTRTILLMVGLLALAGVGLLVLTVWFWRTTRPEHPALGPLEEMGSGRFWKASATEQVERLDRARPDGAEPERLVAQVLLPYGPRPAAAAIDLERIPADAPLSFEDLAAVDEAHGEEHSGDPDPPAPIDPLLGPRT